MNSCSMPQFIKTEKINRSMRLSKKAGKHKNERERCSQAAVLPSPHPNVASGERNVLLLLWRLSTSSSFLPSQDPGPQGLCLKTPVVSNKKFNEKNPPLTKFQSTSFFAKVNKSNTPGFERDYSGFYIFNYYNSPGQIHLMGE